MLKLADFVFVDREDAPRRQEALDEAVEKIKKKRYSFLIFPEGTRSRERQMQEFQERRLSDRPPRRRAGSAGKNFRQPSTAAAGADDLQARARSTIELFRPLDPDGIRGKRSARARSSSLQQKIYAG